MLNEERIRKMTKAAIYEKKTAGKKIGIARYYLGDYISYQVIKAVLCMSIIFVIFLGGWGILNLEYLMNNIHKMDLLALGSRILFYYVVCVVLYGLAVYLASWYRYHTAQRDMKKYYRMLKDIDAGYAEEEELLKTSKEKTGGNLKNARTFRD